MQLVLDDVEIGLVADGSGSSDEWEDATDVENSSCSENDTDASSDSETSISHFCQICEAPAQTNLGNPTSSNGTLSNS